MNNLKVSNAIWSKHGLHRHSLNINTIKEKLPDYFNIENNNNNHYGYLLTDVPNWRHFFQFHNSTTTHSRAKSSRIKLALRILESRKNWNIDETFWVNTHWMSGGYFFRLISKMACHRLYWKIIFWSIGHTIKCSRSFVTNLMVDNSFLILLLHFCNQIYLRNNLGFCHVCREITAEGLLITSWGSFAAEGGYQISPRRLFHAQTWQKAQIIPIII